MTKNLLTLMKNILPLALALLAASFISGCELLRTGVPQDVVILSFPTQSEVFIDGESAGLTPLSMALPRKANYEVRLEKEGYNPAVKYFTPVPNEKSGNFVRFGLSRDLGYYVDLEPRKMKAKMKSELVPNSLGSDPFEKMAIQALKADDKLAAGEITPLEHKVIIEQIIEFFEAQS